MGWKWNIHTLKAGVKHQGDILKVFLSLKETGNCVTPVLNGGYLGEFLAISGNWHLLGGTGWLKNTHRTEKHTHWRSSIDPRTPTVPVWILVQYARETKTRNSNTYLATLSWSTCCGAHWDTVDSGGEEIEASPGEGLAWLQCCSVCGGNGLC